MGKGILELGTGGDEECRWVFFNAIDFFDE